MSLKKKDQIQFKLPGEDKWITATKQGRAGKTTGTKKKWFNVQDYTVAGEQKSLDLKTIEWKNFSSGRHVNLVENDTIPNHEIAKQD